MGGRAPRNPEAGTCLVRGEEDHRGARAGGDRGRGAWPVAGLVATLPGQPGRQRPSAQSRE